MSNQHFTKTILVDQSPAEVFPVILNVRKRWSGLYDESFEGRSERLGDEFSFFAGGGAHYSKQRLVEFVPNQKVSWLVTDANLSFVDDTREWVGTKISFEISQEKDKTKIVFTHVGLIPGFQCYESCAPAWTQYLDEKLVKAITKEKSVPQVAG